MLIEIALSRRGHPSWAVKIDHSALEREKQREMAGFSTIPKGSLIVQWLIRLMLMTGERTGQARDER